MRNRRDGARPSHTARTQRSPSLQYCYLIAARREAGDSRPNAQSPSVLHLRSDWLDFCLTILVRLAGCL